MWYLVILRYGLQMKLNTLGYFLTPSYGSNFKLKIKSNVVLVDFKIRFVNEIKYLGVFLNSKLRDDEDINRQVRYLYGTANRLKTCFYKCTKIKNKKCI